ncbi:hypothetical protein ACWCPT_16190 [Streptomyces sp. NPDC002308]
MGPGPARHGATQLRRPRPAANLASRARREAGQAPTAAAALAAAVSARSLAALGDVAGAARAAAATRTLAERLDSAHTADTWHGYPEQKHYVHLSQAYTLLGDTAAARTAQDHSLALTESPLS